MTRTDISAVVLLIPLGILACARGFGADGGPAVAARSETASRPRDESAIVFTPDGMPAAGAQVAVANWTAVVKLEDGKLSYSGGASERGLRIVETDAAGRFSLPAAHESQVFVVAHDSGFAEIDDPRPTRPTEGRRTAENAARPPELRIALQRFGRVMGTMLVGDKPVAGARFRIAPLSSKRARRAPLLASHLVETDATG